MKRVLALVALAAVPLPALAQSHDGQGDHAGHAMPAMADPEAAGAPDHSAMDHPQMDHAAMGHGTTAEAPALPSTPPPGAGTGPARAADAIWGADAMRASRAALFREHGAMQTGQVLVERLEARLGRHDAYLWDARAFYGGDIDKFVIKSEGEGEFGGSLENGDVQALWSHAVGPYFDLQGGVRQEIDKGGRTHVVLGIEGLAPYMFHVDAATFLSDKGDLTARAEAEYDQRLTQRLILQPRIELALSAQDIPERGIGSGLTSIEAGLRLRYEISRQFAPYVGYGYERLTGRTANYARADGESHGQHSILAGVRLWF
jgi:copper resistance protein B